MANGATLGPRTAAQLVAPAGLDGSTILNFQLANIADLTPLELISQAAATIGAINEQIYAQWSNLLYITTRPYVFDQAGVAGNSETPEWSEMKNPDPVHGTIAGHMIDATDKADAVAWTEQWMRDAFQEMVDADLRVITQRWRNKVNKDILRRLFSNTYNAIGTAGYDMPFVDGSATVAYTPPPYGDSDFDGDHTHFLASSGSLGTPADAVTQLEEAVEHLLHHGIDGADGSRFILFISQSDIAKWAAIGNYVQFVPAGIQVVAGNSNAPTFVAQGTLTGVPGQIMGFYMSRQGPLVEIRASARIPANYAWLGKSFGENSPQNPIAVRVHPRYGFGMRVDPQVSRSINPALEFIYFKAYHGVSVANRLNGVALRYGNADWANPTIG